MSKPVSVPLSLTASLLFLAMDSTHYSELGCFLLSFLLCLWISGGWVDECRLSGWKAGWMDGW